MIHEYIRESAPAAGQSTMRDGRTMTTTDNSMGVRVYERVWYWGCAGEWVLHIMKLSMEEAMKADGKLLLSIGPGACLSYIDENSFLDANSGAPYDSWTDCWGMQYETLPDSAALCVKKSSGPTP